MGPSRSVVVLAFVVACGGGSDTPDAGPADAAADAPTLPAFRNAVTLPDNELALQSLQILGAAVPGTHTDSCNGCHGLTKQRLRYWRALSDTSMTSCLTDLQVSSAQSAQTMLDCMREMPTLATSDYQTKKLGIYSTAARLPWFQYAFWVAYGDDTTQLTTFQNHAGMPKDGLPSLTQSQFDLVAEWFVRGLPLLDETLTGDPPPQGCEAGISSDVPAHVTAMATTGWRAINRQSSMAMFGCGSATDPIQCLQDIPLAVEQPFGTGWDLPGRGRLRVLKDVTYVSSYWTRSSADGRFVGHGVSNVMGSYIIDLQRDVTIPINTTYDPAFFPDNSGFVFQGGPRNTCAMSVLTSNPTSVTMNETGCRKIGQIGLYQHVGQLLGGGDYFALDNEFVSDDGGKDPTLQDPDTSFGANAYSSFTPMLFNGTTYVPRTTVNIDTPFEGDTVLSPSAKLSIARVAGPNDRQVGYVLRKVNATFTGTTYTIAAPEIARYCMSGGKPGFSYDERWIAFHHYVTADDAVGLGFTGPSDPAFQPYLQKGAANLYLMDLATGVPVRITNMQAGQYALFPHFRSDGWIYAQVRDANASHEYTVATDAALLLE
ncbi:MAG: putative glycoside hydrolase [Myxococcales bacterium]|nr:putative glycoside hydrolase [Myxococcales bacterium]